MGRPVTGQLVSLRPRYSTKYAVWRRSSLANPLVEPAKQVAGAGSTTDAARCSGIFETVSFPTAADITVGKYLVGASLANSR